MKQSESISQLAVSLVAAQAEFPLIGKDASNPDFRSKYSSLDKIVETVRPILASHGFAVLQGATDGVQPNTLHVSTRLLHTSGEWIESDVVMPMIGRMLKGGERGAIDPQAGGSAVSYGRRYGLAALLVLVTGEDDDGNAASRQPVARAPRAAAPKPADGAAKPEKVYNPPPKFVGLAKDRPMPFGKTKGTPLGKLPKEELESVAKWATGRPGFEPFLKDVRYVLADISLNVDVRPTPNSDELMARVHASIEKDEEPLTALLGP